MSSIWKSRGGGSSGDRIRGDCFELELFATPRHNEDVTTVGDLGWIANVAERLESAGIAKR